MKTLPLVIILFSFGSYAQYAGLGENCTLNGNEFPRCAPETVCVDTAYDGIGVCAIACGDGCGPGYSCNNYGWCWGLSWEWGWGHRWGWGWGHHEWGRGHDGWGHRDHDWDDHDRDRGRDHEGGHERGHPGGGERPHGDGGHGFGGGGHPSGHPGGFGHGGGHHRG